MEEIRNELDLNDTLQDVIRRRILDDSGVYRECSW